ncbi:glycosyltransferase family 4 protein [Stieleria neptunia]|uniref:glycosyltransferase family 4 protein n=1 Tax=Stieleria neptunia TaxID=2527979 RepID=UPI0021BC5604|nr:glycosyltransferase family 4 protein [Stieleria neptunia]
MVTQGDHVQLSTFSANQLHRNRAKLQTIATGVDDDRIRDDANPRNRSDPPWDPFRMICVGSVNQRKNQMLLLRAFGRITRQFPFAQLRLVGPCHDRDYLSQVRSFIAENGLESKVDLLGWRDDVARLLSECHLFVLTSNIEGVPQAVLEAMKSKLPVLATAAGGIPDVITDGKTGWISPVGDEVAFAEKLSHCLSNQHLLPEVASAGADFVANQRSIRNWATEYQALFDELLVPTVV